MKGAEDKYSLALFSFMKGTIQVPEELIDEDNPQQFKSFDNFQYLKYCATHGSKEKDPLKAYCGVWIFMIHVMYFQVLVILCLLVILISIITLMFNFTI